MLPSPLAILTGVVAVFFVVLTVVRGPVDADYWWHLTTGRLILESGSIPTTDPYSFAYDGPWVTHEWLGEVIIAALVDRLGFAIAAGVFGLATASALMLPAWVLYRRGVSVLALLPFVVIGTYTLASYATVRPQVVSWLLLAGLLVLLITLRAEHRYRPWLVVPLMLVWANLHGLWVVGLGVIGVYVLFTLLRRTPMASRPWTAAGMFVAAATAAVLTPAGFEGLVYPLRYLRQDDWGTAFIAEWQPADFTDPRQWGIALLIVSVVLVGWRRQPAWLVAIAILALGGALVAVRNAPLAVILTMPMLAIGLDTWLRQRRPQTAVRTTGGRRLMELALGGSVIVAIVVILPASIRGGEEAAFPVEAFDALVEADADAHAFVEYDWGGYAIHRLYENGGQVFIDGRSDMYPHGAFEDYLTILGASPPWEDLLDGYGVEAILVPPSLPLAAEAAEAGWCEEYRDERAVLFTECAETAAFGRQEA